MNIEKNLLISMNTSHGIIEVRQNSAIRSLYIHNQNAVQSQLNMKHKEILLLQHSRAMMSFLMFQPNPKNVLLLGVGGGSIIHFLCHWLPSLKLTAVDISKEIIDIATKYFDVKNSPQVAIEHADARDYLSQTQLNEFEIIIIDLHDGKNIPNLLCDDDFISQCFHALSKEGILIVNILANNDQDFLNFMQAIRKEFTDISLCITLKNHKNIIIIAFKSLKTIDSEQLRNNARTAKNKYDIEFDIFIDDIVIVDAKTRE